MKYFFKFIALWLIVLLSACGGTHVIKTGIYQSRMSNPMPGNIVEQLHVDVEKHSVSLQFNGKIVQSYSAKPLPRKQWREGCQTNTSLETLETWQLTSNDQNQKDPIFLFAMCGGDDGLSMETATKTILFDPYGRWVVTTGTITKSTQIPDGSYSYTLQYDVEGDPLSQHISDGLKQKAKEGQHLKLRYESDEPANYELLENIVYVNIKN